MDTYEQLTRTIYDAIDELNQSRDPDRAIAKEPHTVLLGRAGALDSLGFVQFAVMVEERVECDLKATVSVMEAVAASELNVCTVVSMTEAIADQIGVAARRGAGNAE